MVAPTPEITHKRIPRWGPATSSSLITILIAMCHSKVQLRVCFLWKSGILVYSVPLFHSREGRGVNWVKMAAVQSFRIPIIGVMRLIQGIARNQLDASPGKASFKHE